LPQKADHLEEDGIASGGVEHRQQRLVLVQRVDDAPVLDGPRHLVAPLPHACAALRRARRTTQAGRSVSRSW
jgi:hypothetical protein